MPAGPGLDPEKAKAMGACMPTIVRGIEIEFPHWSFWLSTATESGGYPFPMCLWRGKDRPVSCVFLPADLGAHLLHALHRLLLGMRSANPSQPGSNAQAWSRHGMPAQVVVLTPVLSVAAEF